MKCHDRTLPTIYTDKELTLEWPANMTGYERYTPNSVGSKHEWKAFQHYRVRADVPEVPMGIPVYTQRWGNFPYYYEGTARDPYAGYRGWYLSGYLDWFGDPGKPTVGLPSFYSLQSNGDFISPPADLNIWVQDALQRMLPEIKSELSLPNFVYELKDFVTVKDTIKQALSLFELKDKTLAQVTGFRWRYFKSRRGEDVIGRAVAGGYLQTKFNILPLLSDISKIRLALSRVERRLNDLITRSGRVQQRHYTFNWQEFPNLPGEVSNDAWLQSSFSEGHPFMVFYNTERFVQNSASTFHAQIEYNYNYTQYQLEHARVLALMDALGINLNPAIIWNAIPWSFVIDWVVGVGRWLDRFAIANMKPVINIRRFLYSVKRQRRITVLRGISNSSRPDVMHGTRSPLPVVTESAYRRWVGLPSTHSITSSGLSQTEFSLAAALVIAQRRRKRNRKF